jgi:hypothetical protein
MRIFKTKKGVGTSTISDIFAIIAFFIFLIVIIFLVSSDANKSRASVTIEEAKTDHSLTLLNSLRTPINTTDGRNITFGEYLAEVADSLNCDEYSKMSSDQQTDLFAKDTEEMDNVMKQMGDFFTKLNFEESKPCLKVKYQDLPICSEVLNPVVRPATAPKCDYNIVCSNYYLLKIMLLNSKFDKQCSQSVITSREKQTISIIFPTRKKFKVEAELEYLGESVFSNQQTMQIRAQSI